MHDLPFAPSWRTLFGAAVTPPNPSSVPPHGRGRPPTTQPRASTPSVGSVRPPRRGHAGRLPIRAAASAMEPAPLATKQRTAAMPPPPPPTLGGKGGHRRRCRHGRGTGTLPFPFVPIFLAPARRQLGGGHSSRRPQCSGAALLVLLGVRRPVYALAGGSGDPPAAKERDVGLCLLV